MGCGHSNLLDNEDFKKKYEKRREEYFIHEKYWKRIYGISNELKDKIHLVQSMDDLDKLIVDEGRNIYEAELSKEQGKNAIYTLAAKEFLTRNLIKNIDVDRFIKDEFHIFQNYEIEDIHELEEIIDQLNLPSCADILTYNGYIYTENFLDYVNDNLKYNSEFYKENCVLYLTKADVQSSKRMIDLGEIIDFNDPIKNLLVFLEPIKPKDYNHSKSKNQEYISNCSNLSFFFDAIYHSITVENLCIISHQRVVMKLTEEAVHKFFRIFDNPYSRIKSLVLINTDIQDQDLFRFKDVFINSKIKVFIIQPPWPTDYILSKIIELLSYSKTIELFVFFHGRKCSDEKIEESKLAIMNMPNIKKAYFEDNYYYLKSLKN